jgi:hypothetical protein
MLTKCVSLPDKLSQMSEETKWRDVSGANRWAQ